MMTTANANSVSKEAVAATNTDPNEAVAALMLAVKPAAKMYLRQPLFLAFFSVDLLVATAVAPQEKKSIILYVLLAVTLAFSIVATSLEWYLLRKLDLKNKTLEPKRKERRTSSLLFVYRAMRLSPNSVWPVLVPTISIFFLLLIRILFVDHFSTNPPDLDFGPKHGDPDQPNIAFTPGGSTFGHCIQGVIATLFMYMPDGAFLTRWTPLSQNHPMFQPKWLSFLALADLVSKMGTIYPVYNFIKRMIKSPTTFATSSYMNNCCEWVMGAMVGLALGMIFAACVKHVFIRKVLEAEREELSNDSNSNVINNSTHEERYDIAAASAAFSLKEAPNKTQPPDGCLPIVCVTLSNILAILFLLSVGGACAVTGLTWNNCLDGGDDCGNYGEDTNWVVFTILILVPLVISGACLLFRKHSRNVLGKGIVFRINQASTATGVASGGDV